MFYDLIIIGGGPAGITAGIYAARQKMQTLLLTKDFGGQLIRKAGLIENYPGIEEISGLNLIKKFENQLRRFDIRVEKESVVRIKKRDNNFIVSTKTKKDYQAKAVIIATGADPRPVEVPGEKKYIGKGVSYCATCDAAFFRGKKVAVIGGGNAGFEAAMSLAQWAEKIYILEYGFKAAAEEYNQQTAIKTGKIEVITNAVLNEIKGDEFVSSIVYQDKERGEKKFLEVQGVFVEIGYQPATSFVKGLVDFNEIDEIKVNPKTGETSTAGLFAAGDADDVPYKQIIIAAGEGAKAAVSAYKYLQKAQSAKRKA